MQEQSQENNKVLIENFVSQHKVRAFCDSYSPSENESDSEEIFNDVRLRKYFQAYPRSIGDPLIVYLDHLEKYGFKMKTSIHGEPVLFCKKKNKSIISSSLDSVFGPKSEYEEIN